MKKYIDLTNQNFGKWKVVCRDEEKSTSERSVWVCQCECGRKSSISISTLRQGKSRQCKKCYNSNRPNKYYKEISGSYWSQIKTGARWRDIEFNIDIKYAWGLFLQQKSICALSGEQITLGNNRTASLDRINSAKGYNPGNVQWVHKDVNRLKNDYKEKYLIELCSKITSHQAKLREEANLVIPNLSKYTLTDGFDVVIDLRKSYGSYIVDARNGKEYLDCFGQFASQALGWNHSSLMSRSEELLEVCLTKVAHSDLYTKSYEKFSSTFSKTLPEFDKFFFIAGGALGVENALKAAFDWKAQKLNIKNQEEINKLDIVHFTNAFHGRSGYTLSITNTDPVKTDLYPKFDWTRLSVNDNELNKLEEVLKKNYVAAIIIEPIQSEGGDIHISSDFLKSLRYLTNKYEALLIFDEVQTGFSSGKAWCYQHFNVVPDLICYAKKIQTGGFASTKRLLELENNVLTTPSRINSTFGPDIVDIVRSTIILETIQEENLLEKSAYVGEYFLKKLNELSLSNVRGRGMMLAFDLASTEERNIIHNKLFDNGMICLKCGDKSIRLRPHLTFSKEDVDCAVDFIKEVL